MKLTKRVIDAAIYHGKVGTAHPSTWGKFCLKIDSEAFNRWQRRFHLHRWRQPKPASAESTGGFQLYVPDAAELFGRTMQFVVYFWRRFGRATGPPVAPNEREDRKLAKESLRRPGWTAVLEAILNKAKWNR